MLAKVLSGATVGIETRLVEVEVDIASRGLPSLTVVGLPERSVEEAKERIRAAIVNTGTDFPARRITVNLAPADLPKEGGAYDLPMAIAILAAAGEVPMERLKTVLVVGELSLSGEVRHANGVLLLALLARREKLEEVFLPAEDAREGAVVEEVKIMPVKSLIELVRHLRGGERIVQAEKVKIDELVRSQAVVAEFDLAEVVGQEQAKRALEIAAAGGHNLHLKGPPGAGKTMLARALPSIMPTMEVEEALEVTKIYSVTGNLPTGAAVVGVRPFRSPHHTISRMGLVGGGRVPMPGEISLAHRGVLFLDEFPEFPRGVLEALRQPMEDGVVSISRAAGTMRYPASFQLAAASNPCPCGYFNSRVRNCTCLPGQIVKYQRRVSGPILDRIDLHVDVPEVEVEKLTGGGWKGGESSKLVRERVERARERQLVRFGKKGIFANARMTSAIIKKECPLSVECLRLLRQAVEKFGLSARAYFKTVKIARTIADLAGEKEIGPGQIAEALQYRPSESGA